MPTCMEVSKKQRLIQAVNFLISEGILRNKSHLGELIGINSTGNLSQILNEKYDRLLTEVQESTFLSRFPEISPIWYYTGEGDMLRASSSEEVEVSRDSLKPSIVWDETERHAGVPIYDVDFACSFVEMYNDFSGHPIGWLSLPPFNDPEKYAVVRAMGDSMSPDIEHGALIVLGRQPLPVDRIFYGDMYGIETIDDMRSIKRIVRSEDKGKVRLVPSNPAYGDYQDYPAEAIRRVYKVFHVLNQRSY